jgi:glycosyltransferase involved in cell wall biosynthesis
MNSAVRLQACAPVTSPTAAFASAPVRVAIVVDTLARGGAERVGVTLANALDPRRVAVCMVQTRMAGPLSKELAPHVRCYALGRRRRIDLAAAWRLGRLFDREEIDVVHTLSHSASYFVRVARIAGGGHWAHLIHDHHGPIESDRWVQRLDRLLLSRVDGYVAVNDRLADGARRRLHLPAERCLTVPNGIALPPRVERSAREVFTVAQVGRLAPEKDHMTALYAAERLRRQLPSLRWLMIGRADLETSAWGRACQALHRALGLEGIVEFVGEQEDVRACLRRADAAALTSRVEALPVALLEAMACGLPVVVTDAGACRLVVEASGGGVVVHPGDSEGIANALLEFARDPERRREAGECNREYVARAHSADAMAERFTQIYERLRAARAVRRLVDP